MARPRLSCVHFPLWLRDFTGDEACGAPIAAGIRAQVTSCNLAPALSEIRLHRLVCNSSGPPRCVPRCPKVVETHRLSRQRTLEINRTLPNTNRSNRRSPFACLHSPNSFLPDTFKSSSGWRQIGSSILGLLGSRTHSNHFSSPALRVVASLLSYCIRRLSRARAGQGTSRRGHASVSDVSL